MNIVHADRGVSSCTASLPGKAHAENAQLSPIVAIPAHVLGLLDGPETGYPEKKPAPPCGRRANTPCRGDAKSPVSARLPPATAIAPAAAARFRDPDWDWYRYRPAPAPPTRAPAPPLHRISRDSRALRHAGPSRPTPVRCAR